MRLLTVLFAMFLVLATASQAMACGAGGGPKDKDGHEVTEEVKN